VTRILWLRGLEAQNVNAFSRDIYIHGTPEERLIGTPASYGCIRMRSSDIIRTLHSPPRFQASSQLTRWPTQIRRHS
jgi:hypothetical protein